MFMKMYLGKRLARLRCSGFLARGMVALLLMLSASSGYAGALYVYETANPTDTAFAGAGLAGRAQDAGTVFTNPAGMTRFNDSAMLVSGGATFVRAPFEPDSNNTISGTDGSASGWVPYGTFAYIHPVSDRLKVGVNVGNNFGLSLDWGNNWKGRYTADEASLFAPQIQPTLAYKVNDWLSVGAGAALTLGYLDAKLRVNNKQPNRNVDGKMHLKDTDFAVQGNFGIMLNLSQNTRVGLRYLTETELDFDDDPDFSRVDPLVKEITDQIDGLDLGVKMPQSIMLGVFHDLNDKWAVLGSVGWEEWSEFGHVDVTVDDTPEVRTDLKYNNVYHVGVGAQYQYSSKWRYSAGLSYDSALSDGRHRSAMIPMGEMVRFGGGVEYKKRKDLTIGTAMDIMWEGDLSFNNKSNGGRVSGEYENVFLAFFTVYAKWQ